MVSMVSSVGSQLSHAGTGSTTLNIASPLIQRMQPVARYAPGSFEAVIRACSPSDAGRWRAPATLTPPPLLHLGGQVGLHCAVCLIPAVAHQLLKV